MRQEAVQISVERFFYDDGGELVDTQRGELAPIDGPRLDRMTDIELGTLIRTVCDSLKGYRT